MQSSTEEVCPWWGKIGLIWLILIPLAMAIYVLAQPLAPNDLWYHLRAGEWMVAHRSFPRVAMFTTSVPAATPYFYQSWIAEIVMYLTLKWSGLAGSQILRAICFTSAIAIFIVAAQRRAKVLLTAPGVDAFNIAARRVVLIGLFALYMSIPNLDLRPQAFSLPLFALFCILIFSWSQYTKRQLLSGAISLVVLMAIWANTHGAFATGLILLFLFCVGETIQFFFGKRWFAYLGNSLNKEQLKIAWCAFAGCAIAACINPRGWAIYGYVRELTNNVINIKYNQEWQPPTWSDSSNAVFFCCGIALALMLILIAERYRNKKSQADNLPGEPESTFGAQGMRSGEILILAAFFVMGLRNVRSILWFALLFLIAGSALLCRILTAKPQSVLPPIPSSMQRMNVVLALFTCSLAIPFLPALKPSLPWPKSYTKRFLPVGAMHASDEFKNVPAMMLSRDTPVAAAAFLRQHPPKGLLWNDMVFGSYLVWALDPNRGPWADPRIELRPDAFWETYLKTCHAENNPDITLARKGFSDVLINKEATNENKLLKSLSASPHWKIAYQDKMSVIFNYATTGAKK